MSNKLGVLIIGSKGAVATTIIAAQCAIKKGLGLSFGLPSETEEAYAGLGLINFEDIVFGGWDIVKDPYSQSCLTHNVVPKHIQNEITDIIDKTDVFPAILVDHDSTIDEILSSETENPRMKDVDFSTAIFTKRPLPELIKSVEYDIEAFKTKHKVKKVVMVNLSSTEKPAKMSDVHRSISAFEKGIKNSDPSISTSMVYAYTAIKNNCHIVNFTPSIMFDVPALLEFAKKKNVALTGKDGKTGQTLYKTTLAPMLKHRALKLTGWYSTNILGNRDGQVLNDPEHCASKIGTKKSVLSKIMGYSDFDHQVHIHYYLPRGDSKEAWDNIDFTGWFDTQMQMKIDWLGDDSILAAPLVTDLIRWIDFFSDKGECGILPQLASYFKEPIGSDEYDFSRQVDLLRAYCIKNYAKAKRSKRSK
ncbi:MAG: inositol-3-phosphate synthase [Nitrospirota bacterium]|nr:inositol-3-phosphate synthase [Nitrospirota bacterium]